MTPDLADTFVRLAYAAGGFLLGIYVGITRNTARQALRQVRLVDAHHHHHHHEGDQVIDEPLDSEKVDDPQQVEYKEARERANYADARVKADDRAETKRQKKKHPVNKIEAILLGVIFIAVCAYGTYYANRADDRLDAANNRLDSAAADRAELQAEVRCVNRVNRQNIDAQKARAEFNEQQAAISLHLYEAVLDPDATQDSFGQALSVAKQAVKDSLRAAADNPFPPIKDVRDCVD